MKSARKMAAFMLLATLLAGCKHKTPVVAPVAAQAPPLPPKPIGQVAALPPVPQPEVPKVGPPGSDQPPQPPPSKPKRTTRRKPTKPATTTPASGDQTTATKDPAKETPPAAVTQQAATGEAPETSPIGQLSTAGESTGTPARQTVLDIIASTEKGLGDLKRTLSPAEQQTTMQIRTFLAKAKQALSQDDLDGAHTLAVKAKVLLDELTKS
jgi:outer membrane biosynthesis protein TonB